MSTVVTIPHGYLTDGILRHEVCLRELRGEDIVFLSDECHGLIPAQWTTEVLMRCVTRLGPGRPTYAEVRSLTLGDREALLLHLRRLTWGEHLRCVLTCPLPGCHEKLDLDLRVGDTLDAAIILSSETLFAALFGALLMGDRLTPSGVLGCSLIFGCILAVQIVPLIGAGMRRMATARADNAQDRAP